jgi:putative glutamine amidotransferase
VTSLPLVAVVAYHLANDRVARWPEGGYGVPAPYIEALRRAGARTAILSPGEPGDPEELLAPFDGLVLVGGGDVDPSRYGATPGPHLYGLEPDRDDFEIELVRAADRLGLPGLCVCRGLQILNVAYGGTLHQHVPELPGTVEHGVPVADTQTVHDVGIEPGTRLRAIVGRATLACSSHHHQAIDRVGDGLVVAARSTDGLIEALERDAPMDEYASSILGVQWHPEDTAATNDDQQRLFNALATMARVRGARRRVEPSGIGLGDAG